MSTNALLRTAFGLLLLCGISSFSGCDKTDDARPTAGKGGCHKTTTTTSDSTSTKTGGAS